MATNLYNSIVGSVSAPQSNVRANPMQIMAQVRQNPLQMIRQAGYTVPDGLNNPQQIVQHLLNSGQISNGRLSQLMQMAQQFGRR